MKYNYSGPSSGVTLQDGAKQREVMLHTGVEVDLPEDNEYVQTLLALGYLTLVAAPAAVEVPSKQPKTAKGA